MLTVYLENEEEYTWNDDEYTVWEVNDPWLMIYNNRGICGLVKVALVKVVVDDKDTPAPIQMKNDVDEDKIQKLLNSVKGGTGSW